MEIWFGFGSQKVATSLEISHPGASKRERFEGVRAVDPEFRHVCWIELSDEARTVQGLLGGGIGLRIEGLAPFEGLTLTVELQIGAWRAGTSVPLDALPQVLTSDQEPWPTLFNETTRQRILRDRGTVVLRARVGVLADDSWTIERSLRPNWWKRGPNGLFLDSELGPLEHGEVSIARPAEDPVPTLSGDRPDAVLLAPLNPDEAVFGPATGFATFCTAHATTTLFAPSMEKPRLRRSRLASAGSVGMQNLAEAWLRWRLAESDTSTAEIRRRQAARQLDLWMAELACGEVWARRESEMRASPANPWRLLVEECLKSGRGLDELVELSSRDTREVIEFAVADIRRNHPGLWVRIGPLTAQRRNSPESLLDDDGYAELDQACARAYAQLADRYRKAGRHQFADLIASADPGAVPDQWDPVIENAMAGSQLRELAELLLPTDSAWWLMSLDLTLIPVGEIAEELHLWATESRRALAGEVPSDEVLRAILSLWITPEMAVLQDWRSALDILVADRSLARAARYLALRARSVHPAAA